MRSLLVPPLLLCVALPSFAATHLGDRVQWQPEIADTDSRLQQPVEIEIIGRAAVPALEILCEATGVSLAVAPEDLSTVGERKLTIISKGLDLKSIMVQIPEALQECHWDIDESGEEPVYLLHRNAGVEHTMEWLSERAARKTREERRDKLVDRMALARQAVEMSPEELAELEKTDPLLARSVRDAHSRDMLEILLTLPKDQAEQFRDTGRLEVDYAQAPERWQKAVEREADSWLARRAAWYEDDPRVGRAPDEMVNWRDHLAHARICFEDWNVEHGFGVWLLLKIPTEHGEHSFRDVLLMPQHPSLDEGEYRFTRLLVATGVPDEKTAFQMAVDLDHAGFRADAARREERHKREWIEPTDPALLQTIVIGDAEFDDFAQLQALIAEKAGLPVVSDYFTSRPPYVSDELRQAVPLWRLLYLIGGDDFRNEDAYLWRKSGDCLVFHRADWPALSKREPPEWLVADYRAKLSEHHEVTLDDLAELAAILNSRGWSTESFPEDLQGAGVRVARDYNRWALLLYASLTTDQKAKLTSPEGLAFDDMTIAQRRQVLDRAADRPVQLPDGAGYRATFHLVESVEERHGRTFAKTELQLRFPEVTDSAIVTFKLLPPEEAAAATAAP